MHLLPNLNCKPQLLQQLAFIIEVDKVKNILRKSKLFDCSRFENDAEHSWIICIMAVLLKEYSNFPIDIERVLKMLLIHDIVEIDAGDTSILKTDIMLRKRSLRRPTGFLDCCLPNNLRNSYPSGKSLKYESQMKQNLLRSLIDWNRFCKTI